jgi:pyruvate formate lyase activating enzyme
MEGPGVREALLWEPVDGGAVVCNLCAHRCRLGEGKTAICAVRRNQGGRLYTMVYGKAIAAHIDPIEKKPFFHLRPGATALSIATAGCNFRCSFCQNWSISQISKGATGEIIGEQLPPEQVVAAALKAGCRAIAYTYTEPTIFFEYALETSRLAAREGIANLFVSNGYMTREMLQMIRPYLHGANIDLKGFDDRHYRRVMGGLLRPVLDTLRNLKELGVWLEVTTLVIPGQNDSDEELRGCAGFLAGLGPEIPWHISAFHPDYKMVDVASTPRETLHRAYRIGKEAGLRYVYTGNLPGDEYESTLCHKCGEMLLQRYGFKVVRNRLKAGACPRCATPLDGRDL